MYLPAPTSELHADRLRALLHTARVLASGIHLERLLGIITEQVTAVLQAERSSVLLYDPASDTLRGLITQGIASDLIRIPNGTGLAGYTAMTKAIVNVPAAQADPRFHDAYDAQTGFRTRSVLCAPLLTPDRQLIGVLQVLNKSTGAAFTAEDEALLEAFCSHAAVAIERARLVEQYGEQQRLQASLAVAQDIQMSLLPQPAKVPPGVEAGIHLQPTQIVGGDLYDIVPSGAEQLCISIGDVSGKGVPAALFMHGTLTLLRLAASEGLAPDHCFERINRVQRNDQSMFVTLFYGILDRRTGCLTYANAGHPPPFVVRADRHVFRAPRARNLPLCLLSTPRYELGQLFLAPDDLLVLYTDGILEAADRDGEEFGEARILQALQEAATCTAQDAVDHLMEAVHAFTNGVPQRDDSTVLALRYSSLAHSPGTAI